MPRLSLVLILIVLPLALVGRLAVRPAPATALAPAAPQAVALDFAPPSLNLAVGDTATVDLRALGATDLTGFEVTLTFDPAQVTVVRVDRLIGTAVQPDPNRTWASLPVSGAPDVTYLQPSPGAAVFGAYSYGTANPSGPSGDLLLARITVRGVAPGNSSLQLASPLIVNSQAQSITPSVASATVVIGGGVGLTATPTRTPLAPTTTATPTRTATAPAATVTPTPTRTATRTPTATATPASTATRTPTATATPASTATRTPTVTPTPPAATRTPTPTRPRPNPDTAGVFRPSNGSVYLTNRNTTGFADLAFSYGIANDIPIAGDWNKDGRASVGIYRNGVFYLKNTNATGAADVVFNFGVPGDLPVAGDWDGDGVDTVGVYRNGVFYLRNSNATGPPDLIVTFGATGDKPLVGDWDGDGIDTIGVFRPSASVVFLRNTNTTGPADIGFSYGASTDQPLVGDWDSDGKDTIGVYRNGAFFLRNSPTTGPADLVFLFGSAGDVPIAGDWDGLP